MRNIFGKPRKPMTERPETAAPPEHAAKPAAHDLPSDGEGRDPLDPLTAASEAAAEHALRDARPEGGDELGRLRSELERARAESADLKDRWLRLNADMDNFRKRTARERLDLIQFAAENTVRNLLPVLDDMERAIANNAQATDLAAVKEGFHLIQTKLLHILGSQGVKPMADMLSKPFDVDRQEAVSKAPAPTPDQKGCVLEVLENGYTLHDKVIRYAKVLVGE